MVPSDLHRGAAKTPVSLALAVVVCLAVPGSAQAAAGDADHQSLKADAETYFGDRVTPFIEDYCIACHQNRRPTQAGVNFSPALKDPGHAAFHDQWKRAVARVEAHDMPPQGAPQPSDADRRMFADWIAKLKYLSEKDPGRFVIRRLTKTEYGNTLHDLFGVERSMADQLPDEVGGEGYLNSLSPLQLEQYLTIADQVLDRIVAPDGAPPTEIQKRLFGAPPAPGTDLREAALRVARTLARMAYRRPPTGVELNVLLEAFELGRQNGLGYEQSLHVMFKAVLVSPQFLFITPAGELEPGEGIVPLDDYQLASRLSYLLWATTPDDELLALADAGILHEPETLEAQAKRLLKDPRSRALFDGFGAQWLGVGGLEDKVFDPRIYPQMTVELREAMYDEARLFFESVVRENRSAISFVDGDFTFLNGALAGIYGLEDAVAGSEMRRVPARGREAPGRLGNAGRTRGDVLPQPHQPGQAGRVGAGTTARRERAARAAGGSGPRTAGREVRREPYPAGAHRTPSHECRLRQLPQDSGPDRVWSRELRRHRPMA